MKKIFLPLLIFAVSLFGNESHIRINQLGYLPEGRKVAVLVSKKNISISDFIIVDALTDKTVQKFFSIKKFPQWGAFEVSYRLDFSKFNKTGAYYIKAGRSKSPSFRIAKDVYKGSADFILNYMRQQRCGFNPFLNDSCHTKDGFRIYHPDESLDSTYIDVKGGWHDATDYLQYVTTSANAVYQMLFAYKKNPEAFGDEFDANGLKGLNGIPDILDEAKWGLDWLIRMNPHKDEIYNQIADDRDHRGFRLPNKDTVSYSPVKGLQRPVYYLTGKPQGVFKYKNRADGKASTAGKFSSAFILGAEMLERYYPELSIKLKQKGLEAFQTGLAYPGVAQTAPCSAPYFYEEDNYTDDMELASAELFSMTGDKKYLQYAVEFGEKEKITPWMGADTARHYQWYPFLNLGHYLIAERKTTSESKKFTAYLKDGLRKISEKGLKNPFLTGIPFIWCSNNLVAAAITQASLYRELTKDDTFLEMESSLRDWLFGCNPWGISMIIGLPENGNYPKDPHSSFTKAGNYQIPGGLIDGPVYGSIYKNLKWLTLLNDDEYKDFQSDLVVYHDDLGDYSTNEPTMDGTASLSYYLSKMEYEGGICKEDYTIDRGAITRTSKKEKVIHLVFTGGDFGDGGDFIRNILKKNNIKASFFFTGDFYRNEKFQKIIRGLIKDGHYLGAHSDKHLLYASWENRDSTLISKDEFLNDLKNNYMAMGEYDQRLTENKIFMPPYEWYNQQIAGWAKESGITLINFSPGTHSNADYTIPEMGKSYLSSDTIYNRILSYEKNSNDGLNGFILLTHIGTDPRRTDKFYFKLEKLIQELRKKSYKFKKIDETIK